MKINVKCEHCGYDDLEETNVIGVFYCKNCDWEYNLNELDIEVVKDNKEEPFFKFEIDRLGLFQLSAILSAVAFKQEKVFEEFGDGADRLMRELYNQTHKVK